MRLRSRVHTSAVRALDRSTLLLVLAVGSPLFSCGEDGGTDDADGASGGSAGSAGGGARCDEPGPEPGTCSSSERAWYFDAERVSCLPFDYTGCGGNQNRFESQAECEMACGGAPYSRCPQAPPTGSCDLTLTCRYDEQGCPCLQTSPASFHCEPVDPSCGMVTESPTICNCVQAEWRCAAVSQ